MTHANMLVNCEAEFDEFIGRMGLLKEKLGPLLFQFPHFSKYEFNGPDELLRRLQSRSLRLNSSTVSRNLSRSHYWQSQETIEVMKKIIESAFPKLHDSV